MNCRACGRLAAGSRLPQTWKVRGRLVLCRECWHELYRLRSVALTLGPLRDHGQEYRSVFEQIRNCAVRLFIPQGAWEFRIADGHPVVRVCLENRWWALSAQVAKLSSGRWNAYVRIARGEALTNELLLYSRPTRNKSPRTNSDQPRFEIVGKTAAWLPREQHDDASGLAVRANRPTPDVLNRNIADIDPRALRKAIRANRISFPSQVPTFPNCGPLDVQHKIIHLYFLMGWRCADIAARYGLAYWQVLHILNTWKWRAVNSGYIQHIPPADVLSPDAPVHLASGLGRDSVGHLYDSVPKPGAIASLKQSTGCLGEAFGCSEELTRKALFLSCT